MVFWFFQYQVLSKLGFKPDFSQADINNHPLPNPYKSANSKKKWFLNVLKKMSLILKKICALLLRTDMQYPTT